MKLKNYPEAVREALAAYAILVASVKTHEKILPLPHRDGEYAGRLHLVAKEGDASNPRMFVYDAGPLQMSVEEFAEVWPKAIKDWNAAGAEERMAVYRATEAAKSATETWSKMVGKGFPVPPGLVDE